MRALGRRGMVASPNYLATGAGIDILRRGGSALDAAIATNAVLAVVAPYLCGIGGDLFAMVRTPAGELVGLNASGRAPGRATPEAMRALVPSGQIPARGPLAVTVPGCVEGWGKLHARFGRLPLGDLLAEAIYYADEGFPATAGFSRAIENSAPFLHPDTPARETFLPRGVPPAEGEVVRQPRLAQSLKQIVEAGPETYYTGDIAAEITRTLKAIGGLMETQDLAEHRSDWVTPLSTKYRQVEVFELPPNSQGIVALLMLNILQALPKELMEREDARYIHTLAEVARLAYEDREAHITDPAGMSVDIQKLLSESYAAERAGDIVDVAAAYSAGGSSGDTVYLCASDEEGMLVSLIESNFMGIGSGVMAGETGIMLQNRGSWFSLEPDHVNLIAPRKRTMHTLMPAMAFKDESPWLVFGTMGGSAQPQIQVEILTRLLDQGLSLDEAIAAPRFDAVMGTAASGKPIIQLEGRFSPSVVEGLRKRGHEAVVVADYSSSVGHAHAIEVLTNNVYVGAADPRADSLALAF